MAITRWDPFRELNLLQDRMNRLFQDSWGQQGVHGEEGLPTPSFVPPVDIYEDEQSIVVKAEIAGIKPEDIDIRVENNTLTLRGERKFEKEQKEENFHRVERRYGSFYRAFTLPNTVETDKVQADYNSGILEIRLAKRAEAKPKQIKVNVGSGKQIEGDQGKGRAA
ncbi:MAG: Hsp20/alpha crystallin family protein [Candidatus Korobacteraceae bacterium]